MIRTFVTYEWFTIFLLVALACITAAKQLFRLRFNDFIWVFYSSKYLKIYSREQKFVDSFEGLLFTNLVLSTSIFLFYVYNSFFEPIDFELFSFLKIILGVALFFLIKIMVERLIGSLFDIEPLMDQYLFQKTTYKNFSGLILLVFNTFLIYSGIDVKLLIYSGLTLVLVSHIIGFVNSYQSNFTALNHNFFYFLLYLCALEIGPYLILFKVLREYKG
jgi:hypothetical protein